MGYPLPIRSEHQNIGIDANVLAIATTNVGSYASCGHAMEECLDHRPWLARLQRMSLFVE